MDSRKSQSALAHLDQNRKASDVFNKFQELDVRPAVTCRALPGSFPLAGRAASNRANSSLYFTCDHDGRDLGVRLPSLPHVRRQAFATLGALPRKRPNKLDLAKLGAA